MVMAAHLVEDSFVHNNIYVVVCAPENARYSKEMQYQLKRWKKLEKKDETAHTIVYAVDNQPQPTRNDLIVDALFGIGLNKPVTGFYADVIRHINASDAFTVSIDTPSGLFADQPTPENSAIVIADKTFSIQFMKTAFLLPGNYPYHGEVELVDIEMEAPENLSDSNRFLITASNVRSLLRPRSPYAHKGTFGHGLLVAGCDRMPGAAVVAATAAMRGGIGKLTVHTVRSVRDV